MNNIGYPSESACYYLFEKEASDIYDLSKFSAEFVNQSLETLMNVNSAFLSRKENDALPFLDPVAGNNQCHLYSLFVTQAQKKYPDNSKEERRFLHLSFLLSTTFLNNRPLLCQVIETAENKKEVILPAPKKQFFDFVKDVGGTLVRTARVSLNVVFERYIKNVLAESKEKSLLHRELYQLSLENLHLESIKGKKTLSLYTLPKLIGVAYFIHETVPFIIRTKVITSEGTGTLFYQSSSVKEEEAVVVFEAIASDEFSIDQFRSIAEGCPSYFERKPSKKERHLETGKCSFCQPHLIDVKPYQKRFDQAAQLIQETFYALSADFMKEAQMPFLKFFDDKEKYPLLTEIFQQAIPRIDSMGLSMKKPLTFTIHHVYADHAKHVFSSRLRMDSSPEAFLQARGFL